MCSLPGVALWRRRVVDERVTAVENHIADVKSSAVLNR